MRPWWWDIPIEIYFTDGLLNSASLRYTRRLLADLLRTAARRRRSIYAEFLEFLKVLSIRYSRQVTAEYIWFAFILWRSDERSFQAKQCLAIKHASCVHRADTSIYFGDAATLPLWRIEAVDGVIPMMIKEAHRHLLLLLVVEL